MNHDRLYFNNSNKVEPDSNSEQSLNNPFNILNLKNNNSEQINMSLDDINNVDISINNLDAKSEQHYRKIFMAQNKEMSEQIDNSNSDQKSILKGSIINDKLEEKEISQIYYNNPFNFKTNLENEVEEFYEDFLEKVSTKNDSPEILFCGMDINDSFIVEQFCVEELLNDGETKKINSYSNEKEEKDKKKKKLNISCNENTYQKTKKILTLFLEKKEGETKFEKCNNKDFENIKKTNFEAKENQDENLEKVKASEISEKIEFNKNEKSEISDSNKKELNNTETNKNIFHIEKKINLSLKLTTLMK